MKENTLVDRIHDVPDGVYAAKWSGYEIRFIVNGITKKEKTTMGVRGMNIPMVVVVIDGKGFVFEPPGEFPK